MAGTIDTYLSRLRAGGQFSGVVLVVYEGKIVIEQGYGWADRAEGRPNLPTTTFRIASLTKAFTAMAIVMLHEQGRLDLAEPICPYLRGCPRAWQPITIHQLLVHTSGIPDYTATPGFWEDVSQRAVSAEELIALVADQPLTGVPGARFAYSNTGYVILGTIIGRVASPSLPAERAYLAFLEQRIFAPLAMDDTGSAVDQADATRLALGYRTGDERAAYCDPTSFFAMGDLYATAEDLYRWGEALRTDRLVPPEARARLFAPHTATPGFQTGYGYGWFVSDLGGERRVWHAGAAPGYRSYMHLELGAETMVIVLSNDEAAPVVPIGRELAAVLIRHAKDWRHGEEGGPGA
ncbi:MAG TPA: serine hydrolase domain-containing protein [Chloroflexaceae bacterium]|nr:serine hydrolase domain-containing protein [Chloroflexaceae bacterium]